MEHHCAVSCQCMHTAHLCFSRQESHLSEQLMQPRCQGLCWCFIWNSSSWQNVARQSQTLDGTQRGTNHLCYLQPKCKLGVEGGHVGEDYCHSHHKVNLKMYISFTVTVEDQGSYLSCGVVPITEHCLITGITFGWTVSVDIIDMSCEAQEACKITA